jgi:cytochrome c oxidase assembly protein subunit 15
MAVDGWIFPEGHFLVAFPIEKWFRNLPTFVEHTHRLFGVLVGLAAIATLVACWATRAGRRASWLAGSALLAICAQGALGGFRVLENSPQLAFLHGVFAQVVFTLLGIVALLLRPGYAALGDVSSDQGPTLRRSAAWCTLLILAQIALGAWYRHGLRTQQLAALDASALDLRLSLHLVGALATFAAVLVLAGRLDAGAQESSSRAPHFARLARRLRVLLAVQLGLGLAAWLVRDPRGLTPFEWAASVAHLVTGAVLMYTSARAWVQSAAPVSAPVFTAGSAPGSVHVAAPVSTAEPSAQAERATRLSIGGTA